MSDTQNTQPTTEEYRAKLQRPTYLCVRRQYDSKNGSEGDVLGWGMQFPSGAIALDWDRSAYPPDDRLQNPHLSMYGSRADLLQATGGSVEVVQSFDPYPRLEGRHE